MPEFVAEQRRGFGLRVVEDEEVRSRLDQRVGVAGGGSLEARADGQIAGRLDDGRYPVAAFAVQQRVDAGVRGGRGGVRVADLGDHDHVAMVVGLAAARREAERAGAALEGAADAVAELAHGVAALPRRLRCRGPRRLARGPAVILAA